MQTKQLEGTYKSEPSLIGWPGALAAGSSIPIVMDTGKSIWKDESSIFDQKEFGNKPKLPYAKRKDIFIRVVSSVFSLKSSFT